MEPQIVIFPAGQTLADIANKNYTRFVQIDAKGTHYLALSEAHIHLDMLRQLLTHAGIAYSKTETYYILAKSLPMQGPPLRGEHYSTVGAGFVFFNNVKRQANFYGDSGSLDLASNPPHLDKFRPRLLAMGYEMVHGH